MYLTFIPSLGINLKKCMEHPWLTPLLPFSISHLPEILQDWLGHSSLLSVYLISLSFQRAGKLGLQPA